jgi:hypothetical protein
LWLYLHDYYSLNVVFFYFLISKFKNVQKCVYSLNSYGLKPTGVNPIIKSFLYNTCCQPVGTYGIGLLNLKKKTINHVNIIVINHVFKKFNSIIHHFKLMWFSGKVYLLWVIYFFYKSLYINLIYEYFIWRFLN